MCATFKKTISHLMCWTPALRINLCTSYILAGLYCKLKRKILRASRRIKTKENCPFQMEKMPWKGIFKLFFFLSHIILIYFLSNSTIKEQFKDKACKNKIKTLWIFTEKRQFIHCNSLQVYYSNLFTFCSCTLTSYKDTAVVKPF